MDSKKELANDFSSKIKKHAPENGLKALHVCGTHEQSILKHGLRSVLPDEIELKMGPGCPVCVTPAKEIDEAIWLAENGVTVATFGDMLRVPGTDKSLFEARSEGTDVRMVYSVEEAIEIAGEVEELVFFGIGFETTAPSNAAAILNGLPNNFSFLTSHRLIPPAMEALLKIKGVEFDGFIAPGHVSTIIGTECYQVFPEKYNMPVVVSGFEALDILYAILRLVEQVNENEPRVDNAYTRAVDVEGNANAVKMMNDVFDVCDSDWRGIGTIPNSGLKIKDEYRDYDARERFDIEVTESRDIHPGCMCHLILTARGEPTDCNLFSEECTPQNPMGPCMVSREGECNIWHKYGGKKIIR
ncbi:hydrogenase formation protein HypD [Methanonatronarchaeum sp. AMET6-2]|uniref:hydrogenase formation protein HypD n=1 Tax=Methanonatronarchaeum sp. AMET6-2 TaxID=2933293 RepID=UPI0011F8516B|nr:hydrogenase formation protein HypD [Methanonatronarchaeum sp. AMET6-2]RZN60960.1 MAG: hydrogenase formation protein HypD [Methanonatronarchaeia archaeon]UOY10654.1 hydrogenase formation protein HypD [Methanonatronarchaeum sp. AMET6-2]